MTTRILPVDEWPRLSGTEAEKLWPHLTDGQAQVLVVESDGEIVGCWVLMRVLHAECLWIAESHRHKTSVARRLWVGMRQQVEENGAAGVLTAATSDAVRQLLEHVGAEKVPGDHYAMRMH